MALKQLDPDNIPNSVLKEFAPELAIVIQDIYNQSLIESYVPQLLKCSIIYPIPKEPPHNQWKQICARFHSRVQWRK